MDQAALVDRGQSLGQRRPEPADPRPVEWPALGDGVGQGWPRDVGGGHPRWVRFGVGADHRGGMEAADLAGGGDLVREPAPEVRVVRVVRVHYLDRNLAPAARLAQENPAHPALAEAAKQPERADLTGVAGLQPIHRPPPGKLSKPCN